MTDTRRSLRALDRLIRVREVRARQALAAVGRTVMRQKAEAALVARVERLIAGETPVAGPALAHAASARASGEGVLGALADDGRARLAATEAEAARLAKALAQARAAVDAAVARRERREHDA